MHVGLVALGDHDYHAVDFARIAEDHNLTIFTTEPVAIDINERVPSNNIEIPAQPDTTPKQVKLIFNQAESLDCLITLTLRRPLFEAAWIENPPDVPQIAWMHMSNEYVIDSGWVGKIGRALVSASYRYVPYSRLLTPFIRRSRPFIRPSPLSQFELVMVNHSSLKDYLKQNSWGGDVEVFKPVIYQGGHVETELPLHIVVPGDVNGANRDYLGFFEECEAVWNEVRSELQVTLLGGTQNASSEIRQACQSLASRYPLSWYPDADWIPRDDFYQVMKTADALALPTHEVARGKHSFGPPAKWGVSVGSGVPFEGIKHGLPVLVPDHYQPGDLSRLINPVDSFSQQILQLIKNESNRRLMCENAKDQASNYNLEAQKYRFNTLLRRAVSSGVV